MNTTETAENRIRTLLLFRHAPVDFPDGKSRCLGRGTDLGASAAGLAEAAELAPALAKLGVRRVFTSPMLRCRQTAEALAGDLPVECVPGLEELDCGDWEGLTFAEIRARWPDHYARRGEDPALPPPNGEDPAEAARRGIAALTEVLSRTGGDLAVVSHSGLNRAMLCALTGRPMAEMRALPQPYLCVNVLHYDGGTLTVETIGTPMKEELHHEETV